MPYLGDLFSRGVFSDQGVGLIRAEPHHQQETDKRNAQDQKNSVQQFLQHEGHYGPASPSAVFSVVLLAPVVDDRKGEHVQLMQDLMAQGFIRARINGEVYELDDPPKLDLGRKHNIEAVVDRFKIKPDMTCLGKVIGGGLPVGAYGGKEEIMSQIAP